MLSIARSFRSRIIPLLTLCGILTALASPTFAQNTTKSDSDSSTTSAPQQRIPIIVFTCSGIDRILQDLDYAFEIAGRPEISESIGGFLAQANDLNGLDKTKPFGWALFLPPTFPSAPQVVGFVPISNIEELKQTAQRANITLEPGETDDLFELKTPGQPVQVRLVDGYGIIGDADFLIDQDFTEMLRISNKMVEKFDVSILLTIKSVPKAVRQLFLNVIRLNAETELQQKDDEPEAEYRIRRASGMSMLDQLDMLVTHGEQMLLGVDISPERRGLMIEFAIDGAKDGELAKFFASQVGRPSRFSPILREDIPLGISACSVISESDRKTWSEILAGGRDAILREAKLESKPAEAKPMLDVFDAIQSTIDKSQLDLFIQFQGEPPQKLVMLGGLRMEKADQAAAAVAELMKKVPKVEAIREIKINAANHRGIMFHRLIGAEQRPQDDSIYGSDMALHVGIGHDALWFCLGGKDALPTLFAAIDKVVEPGDSQIAAGRAPLVVVGHLSKWLAFRSDSEETEGNQSEQKAAPAAPPADKQEAERQARRAARQARNREQRQEMRKITREVFADGADDEFRVESRPTDTGVRVRITLQEAYIRWFGGTLGSQIQREQDRRDQQAQQKK